MGNKVATVTYSDIVEINDEKYLISGIDNEMLLVSKFITDMYCPVDRFTSLDEVFEFIEFDSLKRKREYDNDERSSYIEELEYYVKEENNTQPGSPKNETGMSSENSETRA